MIPSLTKIQIGDYLLYVQVAFTPEEKERGLMDYSSLPPDQGMLFVFEFPQPVGVWMKQTQIPLSISFIDEYKRIIDIQDMAPLSEQPHFSPGPVQYFLEVNQGWFGERQIQAGTQVIIENEAQLLHPPRPMGFRIR